MTFIDYPFRSCHDAKMTQFETSDYTPDQIALGESLGPEIARLTRDYYYPLEPHPILSSPFAGGTLTHESLDGAAEHFSRVKAVGLSVGSVISSNILAALELSEAIPEDSIIWSVRTERLTFPAQLGGEMDKAPVRASEHAYNYWDGLNWHTARRSTDEAVAAGQPEIVASTLHKEEVLALQALAKQTRGLHQIAEVFHGDAGQFIALMDKLQVDPTTRRWLDIAFASSLTMAHEVAGSGRPLKGFMSYCATGYQRLETIILDRFPHIKTEGEEERVVPSAVSESALSEMYRGSASLSKQAIRERSQQARESGRPLPLPASW
jgi:hypothetical protein